MVVENFIQYLSKEKRYSEHTVSGYKTDLKQFVFYITSNYQNTIEKADSRQVRSWLASLMSEKVSSRTIRRKISSLKAFYRYLEANQKMLINPMDKVTLPKTASRLPTFLSEESTRSIFETLEFADGFGGMRDQAILEMFYATGMRLSELVNLKHSHIDVYSATLHLTGKGNKQRIVPMTANLKKVYLRYLAEKRKTFGADNEEFVFLTDKGKKVYPKFVYRLVNNYLSDHTTVSKKSPHVLRHTFATHMLNNGADINAIKELLGHASLSATEVYTHNTIEKIKLVYKQAHPKA